MFSTGKLNSCLGEVKNQNVDFHLDAIIKLLAAERSGRPVKILDVGPGPISMFSNNFRGWNVQVHAADALANDYENLLNELNIDPERRLVRPVQAECENLTSAVGEEAFDFVIMRNALDHTADAIASFSELMKACVPGEYVLIEHFENEAKAEKWSGFHQWNFWYQSGTILVSGRDQEPVDLLKSTPVPWQEINIWRSKRQSGKGWCGALLRRLWRGD